MELRHLQALLAVADEGSFSAAADALDTVQSNVSSHIAKLEKELGVVLVDRRAGRLTEEGEVVAGRARHILGEVSALEGDVAALHSEVRGTVRLGTLSTTARWLIPPLFETLRLRHPLVKMIVLESPSTSLVARLDEGALDFAIGSMPFRAPDVDSVPLFDEDLLLVVPASHPFRQRNEVNITELEDMALLLPPPETSFRADLDAAAANAGFSLTPLVELDGVRMIASLALDGFAPAIIPATALPTRLRSDFQKLSVIGLPRRTVGLALRKSERPSAPTRALLELLHDVIQVGLDGTEGLHPPMAGSMSIADVVGR